MGRRRGRALDDRQPLTGPSLGLEADGHVFNILFQVLLLEYILYRVYVFVLRLGLRLLRERRLRRLRRRGRRLHLAALLLHAQQEPLDLTVVRTELDGLVQIL